jgi:hypothetical protein
MNAVGRSRVKNLKYPVLALLAGQFPFWYFAAANIDEIIAADIWRTLILVVVFSILVFLGLWLLFRNGYKASLGSVVVITLCLSYGHLINWFKLQHSWLARNSVLLPIFMVAGIALLLLVIKSRRVSNQTVLFLNILFLSLTLFSAVPSVMRLAEIGNNNYLRAKNLPDPTNSADPSMPDIYLIILDAYPRADSLLEDLGFDNSAFINQLEDSGFSVIPCSQPNYWHTWESVFTMLNLRYLDEIPINPTIIQGDLSPGDIFNAVQDNLLRQLVEEKGYNTVSFDSGYRMTEFSDMDEYTKIQVDPWQVTPFEQMFLQTTVWQAASVFQIRMGLDLTAEQARQAAETTIRKKLDFTYKFRMFGLDQLDKASSARSPKFVFAHILASHGPYFMDQNGQYLGTIPVTKQAITDQIQYVNQRVWVSLQSMLAGQNPRPVIIIMGDHGAREFGESGNKNFIAVLGPKELTSRLYDTITPVNVMRLVATHVLGGDFPPLPDYSFKSEKTYPTYYHFVPNNCTVK